MEMEDMAPAQVPVRLREIADDLVRDGNSAAIRGSIFGAWKALEDQAILDEMIRPPDEEPTDDRAE